MGSFIVDPDDPRAPTQPQWDAMGDDERARVVANLPSEIPRAGPPEGDTHNVPKNRGRSTLREFFRRRGRSVYIACELAVYYPAEPVFGPDLLVVLDVDDHPRDRWVVSDEERGLDFVLEIHVHGDRRKDFERNVERYARLGIPEYFVYEPRTHTLLGHRLSTENGSYQRILPQGGFWRSELLELDLSLEAGRLQFSQPGGGFLLDPVEWINTLRAKVDEVTRRAEDEARRAEDEARRAEAFAAQLRALGVEPEEP